LHNQQLVHHECQDVEHEPDKVQDWHAAREYENCDRDRHHPGESRFALEVLPSVKVLKILLDVHNRVRLVIIFIGREFLYVLGEFAV